MSETAGSLVTRAFRLARISAAGEVLGHNDMTDGLAALNDMLHGWKTKGIDLGHVTVGLSGTLRVDDRYIEAIRYNLAARLATEYDSPIPNLVVQYAVECFKALQAHTFEFFDDAKVDDALTPRYFRRGAGDYDIEQG
jgi:hypothetical protein